jgi:hypothetical protein
VGLVGLADIVGPVGIGDSVSPVSEESGAEGEEEGAFG